MATRPSDSNTAIPWIILGIIAVGALVYAAYLYGAGQRQEDGDTTTPAPGTTACTMEAKLCPDGSYVGRQGPTCEFAPCPGNKVEVQVK